MRIRLVVIRTADPAALAAFYSELGFEFDYHQHGNGPFHYAASMEAATLEIYPLLKSQTEADKGLRLGFEVDNFEGVVSGLEEKGVSFVSAPSETAFGFMAVIVDPDGRKVEIYKKS